MQDDHDATIYIWKKYKWRKRYEKTPCNLTFYNGQPQWKSKLQGNHKKGSLQDIIPLYLSFSFLLLTPYLSSYIPFVPFPFLLSPFFPSFFAKLESINFIAIILNLLEKEVLKNANTYVEDIMYYVHPPTKKKRIIMRVLHLPMSLKMMILYKNKDIAMLFTLTQPKKKNMAHHVSAF